jgi:hypothetical protein
MTEIVELLRNLYAVSGGAIPAAAWTATVAALLWIASYDNEIKDLRSSIRDRNP